MSELNKARASDIDETIESFEFGGNIETGISDVHNNEFKSSEIVQMLYNKIDPSLRNLPVIFKIGESYICRDCKLTFSEHSYLKKHIKKKHSTPPASTSVKKPHKCNACEKSFKCMRSLQRHGRKIHNQYSIIKKHKCPLCIQSFERRNFDKHFENSHNLFLKPIKLNFGNYEDFHEWKKVIERITKSYFTKKNTRQANGIQHHVFSCHRSGTFSSSVIEHKRKSKAQGSRKINAYCPASMKVVVRRDGKCEVTFQSQHVGHENELHHLNLTYEERKCIAQKLAANLPLNEILSDIRNSASENGSERLRLLTKKDLHNIRASFMKDKQLFFSEIKPNEKLTNDLRNIHNKHAESEHIRADITKIEKGWLFTYTEHNEIYLIKENSKSCDCPLICAYCKVCIKSYICTCLDSSVEGNMCKHIHFFCMERNKIYEDPNNSDFLDHNDDVPEITSNSEQYDHQSHVFSPSELSNSDLSDITYVLEKRNTLKNEVSNLIDSITTEEECKLLEITIKELTVKLKLMQDVSEARGDDLIPITKHPLESTSVDKMAHMQNQQKSNSPKSPPEPLVLQILNPATEGTKLCYIHFAKAKPE